MKAIFTSKKLTRLLIFAMTMAALLSMTGYASLADSTIGRGLTKLASDISVYVMGIGVTICIAAGGGFTVRAGMAADEMVQKQFKKNATTSVICGVAVVLIGVIVEILSGYFV